MGSPRTAPFSSVKRYEAGDVYNACGQGQLDELQVVLRQNGLDVNWAHPVTGYTAVHAAAEQGHDKCLSAIIRHGGVDLAKVDKHGKAPIHAACNRGRIACLIVLVDHGVDPNVRTADRQGLIPAMLCCMGGHVKCLALLLDRGADRDLADRAGGTTAHWACLTGQMKSLQLLIARGAKFNERDSAGQAPLDYARKGAHIDCVNLLIENNALGESVRDVIPMTEAQKVRLRVVSKRLFVLTLV
jgi:ankyrin repeat protein